MTRATIGFNHQSKDVIMQLKNFRIALSVVAAMVIVNGTASASTENYRVTRAEVVVVCPLTIGGGFEAKTQTVSGEVAVAGDQAGSIKGSLSVDLRTLKTGISLRDRHMRDNYLEVDNGPQFEKATIEDIQIAKLDGKTTFNGTLVLHGERRPITGSATLEKRDGGYTVEAEFPVKVSEYKITKPTYLGVGVQDEVRIKVALTVQPATTVASRLQR
jgi:polyisoprenoid-binding protein YceI